MEKLLAFFRRERWSELAIETYERQVSLAERQKTAKAILGAKWAGSREQAMPHKRIEEAQFYSPEIHVEFGPPPVRGG